MLSNLPFQYGDCIAVKQDASRRAVLGLVQPSGLTFQINLVPFQAGNLTRTAPVANANCTIAAK